MQHSALQRSSSPTASSLFLRALRLESICGNGFTNNVSVPLQKDVVLIVILTVVVTKVLW